ncbi:MAG: AmmeMemoRadiSam system protein B [Deltaproteobacteria bacterium]|nr:MAG: AmmeMemoRadiSam system protein B [Deltaproteobacteria bacterium]
MKKLVKLITPGIVILTVLVAVVFLSYCNREKENVGDKTDRETPGLVKQPVVSGQFYPAGREQLSSMIRLYLSSASLIDLEGKLLGMMVPHAGYVYSGPVAAYVYRQLGTRSYRQIVVIAPSHYAPFPGVSALDMESYRTPLGVIPIDREVIKKLIASRDWIRYEPRLYEKEHSLEVQLPFLQRTLSDFKLIPLVMGDSSPPLCRELAGVLLETLGTEGVLYLASSDMSHYFTYDRAKEMDELTLEEMKSLDTEKLFQLQFEGKSQLCGLGPVMTIMELFQKAGGSNVKVLHYANSGDVTGDKGRVVGYGAVAFLLPEGKIRKED